MRTSGQGETWHDAVTGRARKPIYKQLYVQVLTAILLGFLVGWLAPDIAASPWVKALGDGFIKLIKMVIAPIIFCTVASGIAHMNDARKVGRVGLKALVYFEAVSTLALGLGLLIGNMVRPGAGFGGAANAGAVADYSARAAHQSAVEFLLEHHPRQLVGAFARGDILQVLLVSVLFGFALMVLGERGHTVRALIDDLGHAFFGVIAVIMKAAPIGAFGAMAYTIGKYGPEAIGNLAGLIVTFYVDGGAVRVRRAGARRLGRGLPHLALPRLHPRRDPASCSPPARPRARCRS